MYTHYKIKTFSCFGFKHINTHIHIKLYDKKVSKQRVQAQVSLQQFQKLGIKIRI